MKEKGIEFYQAETNHELKPCMTLREFLREKAEKEPQWNENLRKIEGVGRLIAKGFDSKEEIDKSLKIRDEIEKEALKSFNFIRQEYNWLIRLFRRQGDRWNIDNYSQIIGTLALFFRNKLMMQEKEIAAIPYNKQLRSLLKNKKILHIGCGPGHFIKVINDLGGEGIGCDYATHDIGGISRGLKIHKYFIQSLGDKNSQLANHSDFKGQKFDAIVAHDVIGTAGFVGDISSARIIGFLKRYLKSEQEGGIMVFENIIEDFGLNKKNLAEQGYHGIFIPNLIKPQGWMFAPTLAESRDCMSAHWDMAALNAINHMIICSIV